MLRDRRPVSPIGMAGLLVLLALAPAARAQTGPTVQLRYRPTVGSLLQTRTDIQVTQMFVGVPEIPDSETGTLSASINESRRVISKEGNLYRVRVSIDSARGATRGIGNGTHEGKLPFDGAMIEFLVDSVLHTSPAAGVQPAATMADSSARDFARSLEKQFRPALPPNAVGAGATWRVDHEVPFSDFTVAQTFGASGPRAMRGWQTSRVDSLVPRGADTLAYVTNTGSFDPVTMTIPADSTGTSGSMTVRGGLAASEIWSTAWGTWVAAASRIRAELSVHYVDDKGKSGNATVTVEINEQMQVRH